MPHYPQSSLIRKVFTHGQPLVFGKGDIILGNEPEPNGVYYIESGYVKIYTINDQGDELLHIIYGPGELFPLIWAYLGVEPELLLYEALSTCTVWRVARNWFDQFVKTDVHISYAFSMQMAQQFRLYSDRVDNLEYKKAQERVVYRLLFLASRFGVRKGDVIEIDAPITHEVFANSINLARESVSREIEKLEKEQIIRKTNSHIIICDVATLATKLSRPGNLEHWHLDLSPNGATAAPQPDRHARSLLAPAKPHQPRHQPLRSKR